MVHGKKKKSPKWKLTKKQLEAARRINEALAKFDGAPAGSFARAYWSKE